MLHLFGLDDDGRIALVVAFDIEDMDAALAELDAAHARFEGEPAPVRRLENAASRDSKTTGRILRPGTGMPWPRSWPTTIRDRSPAGRESRESTWSRCRDRRFASGRRRRLHDIDVERHGDPRRASRLDGSRLRPRSQGDSKRCPQRHRDRRRRAVAAAVTFDLDDFDAALAELDARYITGEAAAHAHTWSVIASCYAGFNRHELPATTPDWVSIDHRRGAAFAPGDMIAYIQAAWDDSPDTKIYIEAVHRLSQLGVVVTDAAHGTSQEGFDAEWREVHLLTVEGDLFSRAELFDEADLDAAIARFDQLSRPAPRLENAASRVMSASTLTSRPATGTPWRTYWPTTFPPTIAVEW